VKQIALTKGFVAFVDDEDFADLVQYKWQVSQRKQGSYALRSLWRDGKWTTISMHQHLVGKGWDHRDCDGLNNQRYNLRPANASQQIGNTRKTRGKSKYKGVSPNKNSWRAYIKLDGKTVSLGQRKIEEEAAKLYDIAALKRWGEFARLNFPQGLGGS
jgi:hypothetical protein